MEHIKNIDDSQSTSISSNRSSVTELILDSINYDAYLEQDTNVNQNKKENPNTDLVYTVNPLPHSLLNYVFDFGNIEPNDEIKQLMENGILEGFYFQNGH